MQNNFLNKVELLAGSYRNEDVFHFKCLHTTRTLLSSKY